MLSFINAFRKEQLILRTLLSDFPASNESAILRAVRTEITSGSDIKCREKAATISGQNRPMDEYTAFCLILSIFQMMAGFH